MFARVKKNIVIMTLLGVFLCLTSCNLWYKDWRGYLEYWSSTVQIGRVEVSRVSITKNDAGMSTISVASTPIFSGYIINPKGFDIAESIGDLSSNSSVQVTAAVQNQVSIIAKEATVLQVQVAPATSSLEHTDFTVNFCPVRQDTGVSVGKIMGMTLRYNTPPAEPQRMIKDENGVFTELGEGDVWKADNDGNLYWKWPYTPSSDTDPNAVKWFSIDGVRQEKDKINNDGNGVYWYNTGNKSVQIAAVDSEGISGPSIISGVTVPADTVIYYTVTLEGDGGNFNGNDTQQRVQKGRVIDKSKLATPEKTGWLFAGWLDSSNNPYDFSKPITEDTTLTAQWSQTVYVHGLNGKDSNYGSAADPVKSMEKALEKIYAANDGTNQYTIVIQANYDTSHASSNNTDSLINITPSKDLNLIIKSVGSVTINADNTKRVFKIAPTSGNLTLTIENLNITGGTANYGGGLFISGGDITIQGSTIISKNTAVDEGGGICLEYGNVTIEQNVKIEENSARVGGGVILRNDDQSARPHLTNKGTITKNRADISGGGLACYVGTFDNSGTIKDNESPNTPDYP